MSELRCLLGLLVILAVAFLASNNRSRIPWRTVVVGLSFQVAFAVLVLRWSVGKDVLDFVSGQVKALIDYTNAGIDFLFGKLVADKKETIFALQVLPVIIFIGALVGLAPERRGEVAQLGLKALLAGSLVNLANAAIAGVVAG